MRLKHEAISSKVIKAFYEVYNHIGPGFSKDVYEEAMIEELRENDCDFIHKHDIDVYYNKKIVGKYTADFVIEKKIVIIIDIENKLSEFKQTQLANYLAASEFEVGLVFNFGERPRVKRKVSDNRIRKLTERKMIS